MPSPFPGVDPYIEVANWRNFHNSYCVALRNQLVPQVVPDYVVDLEERLVVEFEDDSRSVFVGDVSVKRADAGNVPTGSSAVATIEPQVFTYRWIEPASDVFVRVLDRSSRRVVTVIEVLSPSNKSSAGYAEYLAKREELLRAEVSLVEVDLLRGGRRLPTVESLPRGDFFAYVTRAADARALHVYSWTLRDPLPAAIPVPLAPGGREAVLDLRDAYSRVYDEGGFRHLVNYGDELDEPFPEETAYWAGELLTEAGLRSKRERRP